MHGLPGADAMSLQGLSSSLRERIGISHRSKECQHWIMCCERVSP